MRNLFYIGAVLFGTGLFLVLLLLAIAGYDPGSSADILLYFFWPIVFPTLLLGLFSAIYPLLNRDKSSRYLKTIAVICQFSFIVLIVLLAYLIIF